MDMVEVSIRTCAEWEEIERQMEPEYVEWLLLERRRQKNTGGKRGQNEFLMYLSIVR